MTKTNTIGLALLFVIILLVGVVINFAVEPSNHNSNMEKEETSIKLPPPDTKGEISVKEAILKRRSVRDYEDDPLSLKEISQLLWAAQGVTSPETGKRSAPSAGALYPLEVYLVVRKGEEIESGVYRYFPESHELAVVLKGDVSEDLARASLGQTFVAKAPINLVFAGVFSRTAARYGERGTQYVYMEAGHAAQNVCLQAESLKLGTVVVGAFNDEEVKETVKMSENETPLYVMPVGRK